MAHRLVRPFRGTVARFLQQPQRIRTEMKSASTSRRNYISEMRKDAFEANILRLLRNEIQYELDRSHPSNSETIPEFNLFSIDERRGEQWIKLKKKFGENEEIKIDVTMFDATFPRKKPGGDATGYDMEHHISMIINVLKRECSDVLEIVCSAWPNAVEISKVFTHRHHQTLDQPYTGPKFEGLDDQLQDSHYEFLETRGINDDLAVFLHHYMKKKDRAEFLHWMETVKYFVEGKQRK